MTTVGLGNVIDSGISGSHIVSDPATEFFVYALLMFAVIGVFIALAMRYTYVDERQEEMMDSPVKVKAFDDLNDAKTSL